MNTVCVYPNDVTVISEVCEFEVTPGYTEFSFGSVPSTIVPSSFRCFFADPTMTRMRDYRFTPDGTGFDVLMGVESAAGSLERATITYCTQGLSLGVWYDCVLHGTTATLTSWIDLTNVTGTSYDDVMLSFASQGGSSRIYSLGRPVTLGAQGIAHTELCTTSRLQCLNRLFIPVDAEFVVEETFIENSEDQGLGIDLPPGPIRVFEMTTGKGPLFLDEGHFPENKAGDQITLKTEAVEDITFSGGWDLDRGMATMVIENSRTHPVCIVVEESEPQQDIVEASHPMGEVDGVTTFDVHVDASASSTLCYKLSTQALLRNRPPNYGMQGSPALTMAPVGSDIPQIQHV